MQLLLLLLLSPWPSSSQSCCSDLLITSSGGAADHQSHRLGSYLVTTTDVSGRPIYKHQEREQFLFYLQSRSKGLWMVGPKVGQFDGGLASPADPHCVEDVPGGGWRYTDGSAWYRDTQLRVRCHQQGEDSFTKTEINAKFKITSLKWDQSLSDPGSEKFQDLANTIENDITAMLKSEKELDDQADFTVSVKHFKKGSVVVDFKVNYVIKEAYIAIPFAIKPSNISQTLGDNFQFQKGILFQRFLIATDSFNSSNYADQCSAKGCSHKCDYDYDREEYVCTCPGDLTIHSDGLNCVTELVKEDADYGGEFTTSKYDDDDDYTEFDLTLTNVDVLTTTEGNTAFNDDENNVNRIGITEDITTSVTTENNVDYVESTQTSDIVTGASTDRGTSIITTTKDQVYKDEASTSKDISSIIPDTSTAALVPDENRDMTDATEESIKTSIRPEIIRDIVEVITTEVSGLTFTEETTTQLSEDTETDKRLTTQPQDITEIGVTDQTTKETLQQSTEEIRTETQTVISSKAEENSEPESTEISTTKKAEDITQERKEETTINPRSEERDTTDQLRETSTESASREVTSTESEVELTNVNAEGTTTTVEDNTSIDTLEVTSPETTEHMILESKRETTGTPDVENMTENSLEVTTTNNEDITDGTAFTTKAEANVTTEQVEGTTTESIELGSTELTTRKSLDKENMTITTDTPATEVTTDAGTGIFEFDCDLPGEAGEGVEELALECKIRNGEKVVEKRTVYIVIDKTRIEGDISRIFDENVRLVVGEVVVEDISPK